MGNYLAKLQANQIEGLLQVLKPCLSLYVIPKPSYQTKVISGNHPLFGMLQEKA